MNITLFAASIDVNNFCKSSFDISIVRFLLSPSAFWSARFTATTGCWILEILSLDMVNLSCQSKSVSLSSVKLVERSACRISSRRWQMTSEKALTCSTSSWSSSDTTYPKRNHFLNNQKTMSFYFLRISGSGTWLTWSCVQSWAMHSTQNALTPSSKFFQLFWPISLKSLGAADPFMWLMTSFNTCKLKV